MVHNKQRGIKNNAIKAFCIALLAFYIFNYGANLVEYLSGTTCATVGGACYFQYAGLSGAVVGTFVLILALILYVQDNSLFKIIPLKINMRWTVVSIVLGLIVSVPVYFIANGDIHTGILGGITTIPQSVFEELMFRGVLYYALRKSRAIWSLVVTSLLFALAHFPASVGYFSVLFVAGSILWYLRYKSHSVAAPLIVHVLHNFAAFAF